MKRSNRVVGGGGPRTGRPRRVRQRRWWRDEAPPPPPPGRSGPRRSPRPRPTPANDTSTNSSSAFSVLQGAGVPAVTVTEPADGQLHRLLRRRGQAGPDAHRHELCDRQAGAGVQRQPGAVAELRVAHRDRRPAPTTSARPGRHAGAGRGHAGDDRSETGGPGRSSSSTTPSGYYTYTFSTNITDPAKHFRRGFRAGTARTASRSS